MKLNKRLIKILSLVEMNKKVIDIGTDHGLVPLYLAKNNISKDILATDISKNSLDKLNSSEFDNYRDIIKTKVTDGFEGLKSEKNQIAIIAGMGANTIINILKSNLNFSHSLDYIIIESNIANEKLRYFLNNNEFLFVKDFLIYDNKKFYDIMKVKKGIEKKYDLSEIYFGRNNIEKKSLILLKKLKYEKRKNKMIKKNILKNSKKGSSLKKIDEILMAIEEVEKKWKLEI
ncbi:MAG: class I SAM-dependent methyltransferase [Peptoniphilaceae bacterium]|nr:class I SAM-dependent methyltransferase [Peptoniphilaceae bacterium]MDD7383526.1 class I SAM-dependent methyltransferase [Peptoniphilaceae bacterium]MDY3738699.1 class I SAM-dependent methyltransferase [Peptoniphilaceae bacterium]